MVVHSLRALWCWWPKSAALLTILQADWCLPALVCRLWTSYPPARRQCLYGQPSFSRLQPSAHSRDGPCCLGHNSWSLVENLPGCDVSGARTLDLVLRPLPASIPFFACLPRTGWSIWFMLKVKADCRRRGEGCTRCACTAPDLSRYNTGPGRLSMLHASGRLAPWCESASSGCPRGLNLGRESLRCHAM